MGQSSTVLLAYLWCVYQPKLMLQRRCFSQCRWPLLPHNPKEPRGWWLHTWRRAGWGCGCCGQVHRAYSTTIIQMTAQKAMDHIFKCKTLGIMDIKHQQHNDLLQKCNIGGWVWPIAASCDWTAALCVLMEKKVWWPIMGPFDTSLFLKRVAFDGFSSTEHKTLNGHAKMILYARQVTEWNCNENVGSKQYQCKWGLKPSCSKSSPTPPRPAAIKKWGTTSHNKLPIAAWYGKIRDGDGEADSEVDAAGWNAVKLEGTQGRGKCFVCRPMVGNPPQQKIRPNAFQKARSSVRKEGGNKAILLVKKTAIGDPLWVEEEGPHNFHIHKK